MFVGELGPVRQRVAGQRRLGLHKPQDTSNNQGTVGFAMCLIILAQCPLIRLGKE